MKVTRLEDTHDWGDYKPNASVVTVFALKENKRPIGFAAWSTQDEKPKRKPRAKKAA